MQKTFLVVGLIVLGGCFAPAPYQKAGVTTAQAAEDDYQCRLEAAQSVPVNDQTRTRPKVVFSTGAVMPAQVYSVDVNAGLRQEFFDRCMLKKGYRRPS